MRIDDKPRRGMLLDVGVSPSTGSYWLAFWCPGCTNLHMIPTGSMKYRDRYVAIDSGFNGNFDKPSFAARQSNGDFYACEYVVDNGDICFSDNCTHQLAGQSAQLERVPDSIKPGWLPTRR